MPTHSEGREATRGRTVMITGAAGGIGQALCDGFRQAGWHVLGTGRRKPKNVDFAELDLDRFASDATYRANAVERLRRALPEGRLDALVQNAAYQVVAPVEGIPPADIDRSFRVNAIAPFLLLQSFLPELRLTGGTLIHIGTIHTRLTKPGFVAYAASKAALDGLARGLAVELGHEVRVVTIAPAAIETNMLREGFVDFPGALDTLANCHPTRSIGTPEDIAQLAIHVATFPGKFLNGATINLDGGISGRLHDPV